MAAFQEMPLDSDLPKPVLASYVIFRAAAPFWALKFANNPPWEKQKRKKKKKKRTCLTTFVLEQKQA